MTNTKAKPKSCGCPACKHGAATKGGNYRRKTDERSHRHGADAALRLGRYEAVLPATYGTYTD